MRLFAKVDDLIAAMIGDLAPAGKAWARVGVVILFVAAAMSFDFGYSVSWKHAAFLAGLTFVAAFGPEAAYKAWQERKHGSAIAIAVACVPLLGVEFYSHAGYTAGLRGHNLAEARVANVKYDSAQDSVAEAKDNLKLWTKQLGELQSQAPWAATVKADALRGQLAVAQKEIDLEAARNGCKTKCAARMKEKADLEERIGKIEQMADLTARIDATKRLVDGARAKADTTEHKSSAVAHQNAFLANVVALVGYQSLTPTKAVEVSAEQSANIAMALVGTGLPAFALFIAGLYRRRSEHEGVDIFSAPAAPLMPKGTDYASMASAGLLTHGAPWSAK